MVREARFDVEVVRFHVDASPVARDKYIIGKISRPVVNGTGG